MEVPGIEPTTSWLVVRHTDHSANETVKRNNIAVINILLFINEFNCPNNKRVPMKEGNKYRKKNYGLVSDTVAIISHENVV